MPVVMTVPMSDVRNIVVGETFIEFLRLGCRTGYFSLEQLAYDWQGRIEKIQKQTAITDEDVTSRLRLINDRFGLEPWSNVGERLGELQCLYRAQIELEPV